VAHASSELLEAISNRLAQLLEGDGASWNATAAWLDGKALEEGIDVAANYRSPKAWAVSVVDAFRHYVDPERFVGGVASIQAFETLEDLFWAICPHWRHPGK